MHARGAAELLQRVHEPCSRSDFLSYGYRSKVYSLELCCKLLQLDKFREVCRCALSFLHQAIGRPCTPCQHPCPAHRHSSGHSSSSSVRCPSCDAGPAADKAKVGLIDARRNMQRLWWVAYDRWRYRQQGSRAAGQQGPSQSLPSTTRVAADEPASRPHLHIRGRTKNNNQKQKTRHQDQLAATHAIYARLFGLSKLLLVEPMRTKSPQTKAISACY